MKLNDYEYICDYDDCGSVMTWLNTCYKSRHHEDIHICEECYNELAYPSNDENEEVMSLSCEAIGEYYEIKIPCPPEPKTRTYRWVGEEVKK